LIGAKDEFVTNCELERLRTSGVSANRVKSTISSRDRLRGGSRSNDADSLPDDDTADDDGIPTELQCSLIDTRNTSEASIVIPSKPCMCSSWL
jgi:hypothetical protein